MASYMRIPTLLAAVLSIGLSIAIIGTAGRTLTVYQTQHNDNAYFLPLWASHFDLRELGALIGTSTVIVVLNAILAVALFVTALPANLIVLASSSLSTVISILAVSFSAVLNNRGPRDTLQSWTCRWRDLSEQGVPRQFDTLCHETRFAFYTTIPVLILQLILLALALYAIATSGASSQSRQGRRLDEEKLHEHELSQVRQQSFDTKTEASVRSGGRGTPDSLRIMTGMKQ